MPVELLAERDVTDIFDLDVRETLSLSPDQGSGETENYRATEITCTLSSVVCCCC